MSAVHRNRGWSPERKRTIALAAVAVSVAALASMAVLRAKLGPTWVPPTCKAPVSADGAGALRHLAEGQARVRWRLAVRAAHGAAYGASRIQRGQKMTCAAKGNAFVCTFVAEPCVKSL